MNNHKYNLPMVDLKNWYKSEVESVGHLAAMKDEYLRRRYASKVVSGMKHLADAIEEKMNAVENGDRRMNLSQMRDRVLSAMEHVKKDYDVTENNISYAWNTTAATPEPMNYAQNNTANKNMNMSTPENMEYAENNYMNTTPTNEVAPAEEEYEEILTPAPNMSANTVINEENTQGTNRSLNDLLRELTGMRTNVNAVNKNKQTGGGKRRTKRKAKKSKAKKGKKGTRRH